MKLLQFRHIFLPFPAKAGRFRRRFLPAPKAACVAAGLCDILPLFLFFRKRRGGVFLIFPPVFPYAHTRFPPLVFAYLRPPLSPNHPLLCAERRFPFRAGTRPRFTEPSYRFRPPTPRFSDTLPCRFPPNAARAYTSFIRRPLRIARRFRRTTPCLRLPAPRFPNLRIYILRPPRRTAAEKPPRFSTEIENRNEKGEFFPNPIDNLGKTVYTAGKYLLCPALRAQSRSIEKEERSF